MSTPIAYAGRTWATAREWCLWIMRHNSAPGTAQNGQSAALDAYRAEVAHELAEQIRESARATYSRTIAVKGVDLAGAWMLGHDRAAALIDPEVSGGTPDAG